MTPQEQELLKGLTDRVNQTVLQDKDPEAEQYLTQSLSRNPDAIYILAQTVLVQQYAVEQANKQLDDLKQQLEQARQQVQPPAPVKHTSFLGSLLGNDEPQRPAPPPPPQPYSQAQYAPVPNYAPQPTYGQPQYAQPAYSQPSFGGGSGGGGFLRGALQTAGGVAAGALAFEGIESLMHGFGEHAGYGSGAGFGGMGGGPREEVINNYYGDDDRDRGGISRDIEDRRDDNRGDRDDRNDRANFADTGSSDDLDSTGDTADDYGDDSSSDDSDSVDDFGSSDDSN